MIKITVNYGKPTSTVMVATKALLLAKGKKDKAKTIVNTLYGTESRNSDSMKFAEQCCDHIDKSEIAYV